MMQAGFEDPVLEVERRLSEAAAGAESVKELLGRAKGVMSAELSSALLEAVAAVEAESNATLTLDGSSPAYKKFAEKVKVCLSIWVLTIHLCVGARLRCGHWAHTEGGCIWRFDSFWQLMDVCVPNTIRF